MRLTNKWAPISINDYKESVSYDPNGNILGYLRNGAPSLSKPAVMDSLTYNYDAGTNRLNYVDGQCTGGPLCRRPGTSKSRTTTV